VNDEKIEEKEIEVAPDPEAVPVFHPELCTADGGDKILLTNSTAQVSSEKFHLM
jgi:hypothetical protein